MASINVVDVRKSYGGHEVIHGVSLDIADGDFVDSGRTLGLRQVHAFAHDRGSREHYVRRRQDRQVAW